MFWICIHYEGPANRRIVPRFDKWNYIETKELANSKKGAISDKGDFLRSANKYFTDYYRSLIPCVNILRKTVFPHGRQWIKEDSGLYDRMKEVLQHTKAK